uniref:Uncharacterized protein n=1 Tax=Nelumbo nucifera TaxID=4432 RepID=A0A822ZMV3_NELNU|nr:TPA_asm: hypothetical protein HUJ06_004333 [Nelumbo nucifera]
MDFFKVKKFRKAHKPDPEKDQEDKPVTPPEEMKTENGDDLTKSSKVDPAAEAEDDDDDDFITKEVKRRLKELRRNSFMVLIPEESCAEEEEEEEETSSSEWKEPEVENGRPWCRFDTVYDKYCERMLFFDRMSAQQLHEAGKLFFFFFGFNHISYFFLFHPLFLPKDNMIHIIFVWHLGFNISNFQEL